MQLASQLSILKNYMKTKRGILHNTDARLFRCQPNAARRKPAHIKHEKHNNEYSSPNFNNKCYVILDGEFILKPLSDFGRIY